MSFKKDLIRRFPWLYQIYYEQKTRAAVRANTPSDREDMIRKLKEQYLARQGFPMNAENPERFTDWIQWRKLYDPRPEYAVLSDKIAVRDYVAEKIGEQHLIPLLGTWERSADIDYSALPDRFVLKTNNASGTVLLVKDKAKLDRKLASRKLDYWLSMPYWYIYGYEMHYAAIPPRILAEPFIEVPERDDLPDWKFLCFNGRVEYIWVDTDRFTDHKRVIFNRDMTKAPWRQSYSDRNVKISYPENMKEMIGIAEKLAAGFDHIRVDLYNVSGKILFGELTFTSESGFEPILPDEWNKRLGTLWKNARLPQDV